jgi:hypothetical protein
MKSVGIIHLFDEIEKPGYQILIASLPLWAYLLTLWTNSPPKLT